MTFKVRPEGISCTNYMLYLLFDSYILFIFAALVKIIMTSGSTGMPSMNVVARLSGGQSFGVSKAFRPKAWVETGCNVLPSVSFNQLLLINIK